ncbi:KEOPS complex subunit Pcc1 [Natronosalvus vescus]|uniref:KEOPS complex subunit Pcc1 n=1 Tax=Natronosalvus vescus TaxID=2953881 RepID=UPI00208FFF84|nr:KEOPS complex subunit Pcc1 [Natronosalvus vescus]
MTGDGKRASRRATIRTRHDVDSSIVVAAIAPDNTDEMDTRLERADGASERVVTTIERETTGGLHSTVDDYVVNLDVAERVAQHGRTTATTPTSTPDEHESATETDTDTNTQ